jgi:hypothetical protein
VVTSYTFPNIATPDKDKDLDYYRRWGFAIVSNTFTNTWTTNYNKLQMLSSLYQFGTGSELTGYLQTNPDGSAAPGIWTSLNSIKARLRVLLGELEERGYIIKAKALNSEATARKFEEKERLRIKRKLQDVRMVAEEMSGIPLESQEYVPQSEEELNEYIDLTWKDKHVLILEAALKWIAQRTNWDEKRKRLFLNTLWANRAIVRNDIVRGIPQPFEIDPLRFIFDPNSSDDLLSDSTYFGEVEYMPLAAAAERYGLTLKELEEAYGSYETYLGLGIARGTHDNGPSWGAMPGQCLRWFKVEDGTPRCLVIRAVWRDYKTLSHKYEENEKGKFLQDMTGKEVRKRDEDKMISKKIECWRQVTLIGGTITKEWGECPNQARSLDSLEVSEPPYTVWIPEFLQGRDISLVEQLAGLQLLKDIALYQLQIQMARQVGRVLVLDMAMFPEGMTKEQVLSYMKADGVVFVNSKEYQLGSGMNLFKDYDLSLSQTIAQQIQLISYFDQQTDSISGVNSERQGQVQGSSQAVGVTEAALFQSNLITAPYFKGFERFCSRVLNHQAKLVKIAWAGKEIFAPIIGDVGIDFLKDNVDISLDEFDVVIQSLPPTTLDRKVLQDMIMIALQSGELPISDAMDIMLEPDTTVAVRKFRRRYQLRQMFLSQQEAQAAQQEQQMQEQQMMLQNQQAQGNWQNQLQLQQMKNQGNITKTLLTGRVKLADKKLSLLGGR